MTSPTPEGHAPHSEHSTHTPAQPAGNTAGTPQRALVIGGILILLILIVGGLVYTKFFTPNTGENTPEVIPVQVKLVIDDACEFCIQTNTILAKLDESNIVYNVETYSIHSAEGQKLVDDFEIDFAPTALLSVAGLDQNTQIQAALQGRSVFNPLRIINGYVVVPEQYLTKQAYPITYTSPPTTCNATPDKVKITAYLDFGKCTPCAEAYVQLEKLKTKYGDTVDVTIVPIMFGFPRTNEEAAGAFLTNKGALCAQELGFYEEYTECSFFDSQFYGNLSMDRMLACLSQAGGKSTQVKESFQTCVLDANETTKNLLVDTTKESQAWNPSPWVTPWFVMDCTYAFTGHNALEAYMCMAHPEIEGCAAVLNAFENPTVEENAEAVSPDTNASQPVES